MTLEEYLDDVIERWDIHTRHRGWFTETINFWIIFDIRAKIINSHEDIITRLKDRSHIPIEYR